MRNPLAVILFIFPLILFLTVKKEIIKKEIINPTSWYGFTKVHPEGVVETNEISWAIVRTCLVYGNVLSGTRSNIVSWIKQNLEQEKPIKAVSDQWRTTTDVEDLAKGILLIIQKRQQVFTIFPE